MAKEGDIHTAIRASVEAKRKASEKPRFKTGQATLSNNLFFMNKISYVKGRKTPKY